MNRILRVAVLSFTATVLAGEPGSLRAAGPGTPDPAKSLPPQLASLRDHSDQVDPHALDVAWPFLNSRDPAVREAARQIVEAQPFDAWKQRALDEKSTWASLESLRALVETCPKPQAAELSPHLCDEIATLRIDEMNEPQQLATLQLTRALFVRLGPLSADERKQMLDLWSAFPGPLTSRARAELTRLVDFLEKIPVREGKAS